MLVGPFVEIYAQEAIALEDLSAFGWASGKRGYSSRMVSCYGDWYEEDSNLDKIIQRKLLRISSVELMILVGVALDSCRRCGCLELRHRHQ